MLLSLFHTLSLPVFALSLSLSFSITLSQSLDQTVCKHPVLPVLFHSCSLLFSSPHMNVSCSAAVIITAVLFFPSSRAARASLLCLSLGDVPLVCAGGSKVPLVGSQTWLITFSSPRLSHKMSLRKKLRWRSPKRK